ncbi:hypothetical protein AB1A65_00810 [Muricauda sp. ANG21]|uniref:hypothetical protein n=1 Tax=Allomuricauda sp. ANG21 TaxID=3042468 RepID=UPI003454DEA9
MNKSSLISSKMQGIDEETCVELLKLAYESVKSGIDNSRREFHRDPAQYDYRTAKAVWMNAQIKKLFQEAFIKSSLRTKVKHLKSHGVDYYLLDGKMLLCFKKMDYRNRVSGFYSKRFRDALSGNAVHYSKSMLDNLSRMGISKPLPIYYIGHILDKANRLVDVRLVNYEDMKIKVLQSLSILFSPNLFSVNASKSDTDESDNNLVRLRPDINIKKPRSK